MINKILLKNYQHERVAKNYTQLFRCIQFDHFLQILGGVLEPWYINFEKPFVILSKVHKLKPDCLQKWTL